MIYLSPAQVLFLHYRLVQSFGGEHGVSDLPALQSALARPQARYDGQELYPNLWWKCAALFDALLRSGFAKNSIQPLAIAAAALFLHLNGYRLIMEREEMVAFTRECAARRRTLSEIALWFERRAHA